MLLSDVELDEIRAIGDNSNRMALKGGVPGFEGDIRADGWPLDEHLAELADRWGIVPERDLSYSG